MMNSRIIITIGFSYIISSIRAYDPDALQDLCVADKSHGKFFFPMVKILLTSIKIFNLAYQF